MTNPTSSKHGVDRTAAVPTQRIVTNEVVAAPPRRDGKGRFTRRRLAAGQDDAVDLPDLSAVLAAVPGGLGTDVVESFTYAGQRWTAADARVNGTPIGLHLAMEQRGLDVADRELEVPLQRAGSRME